MKDSERDALRRVRYNHLISNKLKWDNCSLDLADFALQEQPEDNLKVAITRACYFGSYIMAAKKSIK